MRNSTGTKKSNPHGKTNITITATGKLNQSGTRNNKKTTESSIRENSIEKSKEGAKISSKNEATQNICLINSSITNQPISVNISIRNRVMGMMPSSTTSASSKKITSFKVVKPGNPVISTKAVIGPTPESVQVSPKKKEESKERVPNAKGSHSVKTAEKKTVNISLGHLQHLLKAKTSPKEIQKIPDTTRFKKPEMNPKKAFGNTVAAPIVKKSQTASQSILVGGLNVSRNQPKKLSKDSSGGLFPLTAAQTLKIFAAELSDYEKGEVLDYDSIYYMGNGVAKFNAKTNNGYDDEKGDYNTYVGEHVAYRYEIIDILGKGSFGQAIKSLDHKYQRLVALKIIRSKKRFYHQATVEVKILKYLRDNDEEDKSNMVRMLDYFVFRKHICITFELLSINLYDYIKENNFVGLSLDLIRKYAVQILTSLKMLKEHSIIHCDLKPENILLKEPNSSVIKLIDFGSSCFESERIYTYIQSRFYRAPEIMLGIPYSTAIDMWSLGCILAELYTGFPVFPGESEPEQMTLIMEVNGLPPVELIKKATRREVFFTPDNAPLPLPAGKERSWKPASKNLGQVLKCPDSVFVDFLQQCFNWEPDKRITPDQAFAHRWIVGTLPRSAQGNTSNSTLGSVEMNPTHLTTQIQTYYATQRKQAKEVKKECKKKEKIGLNKTLANTVPATSASKEGISGKKKEDGKLQDRLIKLKERLKEVATKQPIGQLKYNTGQPKKNNVKATDVLASNNLPKRATVQLPPKSKRQLKQSNIF